MGKKVNKPRPLAEIQADMKRAARRQDKALLLFCVLAAAGLAWATTPERRTLLAESWRRAAINQRLCQAYRAVSPDNTYADFPVCLPSMPLHAGDGY